MVIEELIKENQLLHIQLQKYREDDHNSKGQMAENIKESINIIIGLISQIEEAKKNKQ